MFLLQRSAHFAQHTGKGKSLELATGAFTGYYQIGNVVTYERTVGVDEVRQDDPPGLADAAGLIVIVKYLNAQRLGMGVVVVVVVGALEGYQPHLLAAIGGKDSRRGKGFLHQFPHVLVKRLRKANNAPDEVHIEAFTQNVLGQMQGVSGVGDNSFDIIFPPPLFDKGDLVRQGCESSEALRPWVVIKIARIDYHPIEGAAHYLLQLLVDLCIEFGLFRGPGNVEGEAGRARSLCVGLMAI
jgi:hypothetical protein